MPLVWAKRLISGRARLTLSCLAAAGLGQASACTRDKQEAPTFDLSILVENDVRQPLAEAAVLRDQKALATTGVDGQAHVKLSGLEGDRVWLQVRCPKNYVSPTAPLEVSLRRLENAARRASYRVSCPPEVRTIVVAVRATHGPNLPVLYLGREVARTDASGAAHVELRLRAGERFELALSTGEKSAERLVPQNPIAVFLVKDRDEVLFFEQKFEQPTVKAKASHRPKAF